MYSIFQLPKQHHKLVATFPRYQMNQSLRTKVRYDFYSQVSHIQSSLDKKENKGAEESIKHNFAFVLPQMLQLNCLTKWHWHILIANNVFIKIDVFYI